MGIKDTVYYDFFDRFSGRIPNKYVALTDKESDYLSKTQTAIYQMFQRSIVANRAGELSIATGGNFHDVLAAEMQRKRLSLRKAEVISEKAMTGKWYSLIEAGDGEQDSGISFYLVSDQTDGRGIYLEKDNGYYSMFLGQMTNEEYCLRERELLGLDPDYKFITASELYAIRNILRVKGSEANRGTVNGKWQIKSSPLLNMYIKIGTSAIKNAYEGNMEDKGRIIVTVGNCSCSFNPKKAFKDYDPNKSITIYLLRGLNANVQKLFDLIQYKTYLTGYTVTRLKISLREILEIRGMSDMKELKRQLTQAAAILDDMTFTGELGDGDFDKLAITQGDTSIYQGYLYVNINEKFLEALRETKQIVLYNQKLQRLPSRGHSFCFARLFEDHKRRNAGQANENRLSVANLLEYSSYPKYDELADKGQASQKIIAPFLKSLDTVNEHEIFSYRLCKRGGGDLTRLEAERAKRDYNLFSSLIVEVKYYDEPDYSNLISLKAKARHKAKQNKRKQEARKTKTKPRQKKQSSHYRMQAN